MATSPDNDTQADVVINGGLSAFCFLGTSQSKRSTVKPAMPPRHYPSRRRHLKAQLQYLRTLFKRFRVSLVLMAIAQFGGSLVLWMGSSEPISFTKAMGAVYFLMMGETTLDLPDSPALMLVMVIIPPLGLAIVADGLVRFAYLFFAKHRHDKEWIAVLSETLSDHVIVCGAGRVGSRIVAQLVRLDVDLVVIEKNDSSPFVQTLRNMGVPILIDDVRSDAALRSTNVARARTVICATDDDLTNLNVALDARRLNPGVHVVMRFFDEDLVNKVKEAFGVEALSTSTLSAPTFAASALDPSIVHSFEVADELVVVAHRIVAEPLAGLTVAEAREKHDIIVLQMASSAGDVRSARSRDRLTAGDRIVVQAVLADYQRLPRQRLPAETAPAVARSPFVVTG